MTGSARFRAFDKAWFLRHQRVLLWLLNTPALRLWFRWIMRIRPHDCPRQTRILEIGPNCFTVYAGFWAGEHHFRADFRTHWKYSKRLYYAFRPLWWAMHLWDWAAADRWIPEISFGFNTLTVYPDPDPETSSVDGSVKQGYTAGSGVDWATIVAEAGSSAADANTTVNIIMEGDNVTNKFLTVQRAILLFDTHTLTASANISAAVLSLYGTLKSDGLSATPDTNVCSSAPASNTVLVAGDFDSLGVTAFATAITYASWSTAGFNDFTLNANGVANISLTGVSKFGARNFNYDAVNNAPPWVSLGLSRTQFATADSANDPKLVVTYTLSDTSFLSQISQPSSHHFPAIVSV